MRRKSVFIKADFCICKKQSAAILFEKKPGTDAFGMEKQTNRMLIAMAWQRGSFAHRRGTLHLPRFLGDGAKQCPKSDGLNWWKCAKLW